MDNINENYLFFKGNQNNILIQKSIAKFPANSALPQLYIHFQEIDLDEKTKHKIYEYLFELSNNLTRNNASLQEKQAAIADFTAECTKELDSLQKEYHEKIAEKYSHFLSVGLIILATAAAIAAVVALIMLGNFFIVASLFTFIFTCFILLTSGQWYETFNDSISVSIFDSIYDSKVTSAKHTITEISILATDEFVNVADEKMENNLV